MLVKQSVVIPMVKPAAMSLEAMFQAVAGIGYPAVEFWSWQDVDFAEVVRLAKQHRLTIASVVGHRKVTEGFCDESQHARIEAELRESIALAAQHGIPGLIALAGNRLPGQSDAAGIAACVKGLRRVAPYAESLGVNVNLELLNSKVDHAGYFCDRTALGVAICEQVASPRIKLLYDIYHMQIMEGDVIRTIRTHSRWIGHYHTAGNPGRQDLDDAQELNYRGICQAIHDTGYGLYVGHEFRAKGDAVAALQQAFDVCGG